ncbi:MAG: hypothetical protein MNPFHGCM_02790 [Gemmatimonadaceae bacterium]|nr:hypothetical protein [Gemmatimonadaceae bacterium]
MKQSRLLGRSFLAILSGYLAMAILVVVLTPVAVWLFIPAEALKLRPVPYTTAYIVSNFTYSFAAAVAGGWLAARMAPRRPLEHGGALAGVMAMLALGAVLSKGSPASATNQPSWYGWSVALTGAAGALAGGWLRVRQLQRGSGPGTMAPSGADPTVPPARG